MAIKDFDKGIGSIIGSYIPIVFKDKITSISVKLSLNKSLCGLGRCVTACFWPDDKHFQISELSIASTNTIFATDFTTSGTAQKVILNGKPYVNTNTINNGKTETITFKFNSKEIEANRIFFALISTTNNDFDYDDFYKASLSLTVNSYGALYVRDGDVNNIGNMICNPGLSLDVSSLVIHASNNDENNTYKNVAPYIECSNISYRTWSEPKKYTKIEKQTIETSLKHNMSYLDGGEDYASNKNISIELNSIKHLIKTHIIRKPNDDINTPFENDYCIPEGRLSDVIFDSPEMPEYYTKAGSDTRKSTILPEPRWVFKRSRIKFTIPPIIENGIINKKEVYIRYKVITTIFNKNAYTTDWKIARYDINQASNPNGIDIVICPRDEGVLDNMAFRVVLSRSYNKYNWSTDTYYYFHTYQKPTLNIAYPKMIRNNSTNLNGGKGFKFAKILTSNMYSNFTGENAIVNKNVCDALTVILATPRDDNSGIPQFVRFYLAEFKYGRNAGQPIDTYDSKGNKVHRDYTFDTMQSLYKSSVLDDYTTLEEILDNKGDNKVTAYLTNIYSNDGQPILLSGRFTNNTLSDVGKKYKLWTYRTWDYVESSEEKDVQVGNAWPITSTEHYNNIDDEYYGIEKRYKYNEDGQLILVDPSNKTEWENAIPKSIQITKSIIGDHYGIAKPDEKWSDGTAKTVIQEPSNVILFRAGYIYLLRARMFHGAACGAIGAKYGDINSIIYGRSGTGIYDYNDESGYGGNYPYFPKADSSLATDDCAQHGELHPFAEKIKDINGNIQYKNWRGPEDGTTGLPLSDNKVNETYAGFSKADYTIIEPVCPYTSKFNMISVHPTSPEIGANQWITFNYRHLSKNIGEIDTYDVLGKYNKCFTKKFGKCQNTITRIMSMYASCVENILNNYIKLKGNTPESIRSFYEPITNSHNAIDSDCRAPSISKEIVSLWIEPISDRLSIDSDNNLYKTSFQKRCNTPLIYRYNFGDLKAGSNLKNCYCDSFPYYNVNGGVSYSSSGLYSFNKYRNGLTSANKDTYVYDYSNDNHEDWAENNIVWRQTQNVGNDVTYARANEPLGNSYRWQPVINAMTSNTQEIQIEDNNNENAKNNHPITENSIKHNNTFSNITALHTTDGVDYDLQTKYAYNDETTFDTTQYPNGYNFANNSSKRFTINEFAGSTQVGGMSSSGYATMYTSISRTTRTIHHKTGSFKFFSMSLDSTTSYGNLYKRVPVSQDCENGDITTFNGNSNVDLPNIGNLNSKGAYDINLSARANGSNGNANSNNVSPIVRTTHYLYFKTWVNTTFYMQVEVELTNYTCNGYETDAKGNTKHLGDSVAEKVAGVFQFTGNKLALIKQNGKFSIPDENGNEQEYIDDLNTMINFMSMPASNRTSENEIDKYRYNYYDYALDNLTKLLLYPNNNYRLKFGNSQGLSEVYSEDNFGWGRCLSADDGSSKKIKYDGTIESNDTVITDVSNIKGVNPSGGLEVPILVRYTPLLQPKLIFESGYDKNTGKNIILQTGNKNITIYESKGNRNKSTEIEFANGNANSEYVETVLMDSFNLNICYPFIAENNSYETKSPNGGLNGIYYEDYHFDLDTFPANSLEAIAESKELKNMDFLGGYGICTAYTILLVPSDPDLQKAKDDNIITDFEYNTYFKNTDGRWNYYNQYANYYKGGNIYGIRSKSQTLAGPVIVAYNVQPTNELNTNGNTSALNYSINGSEKQALDVWPNKNIENITGRNFQSVTFDPSNLRNGKIIFENETTPITFDEFETKTGISLNTEANILQSGLIYDLVIVPIYSNLTVNYHDFTDGCGTLNNIPYASGISDASNGNREKAKHLAGSNPLVLFNYLQSSFIVDKDNSNKESSDYNPDIPPTPDEPTKPDYSKIWNSDCAIVFPNVDNVKFNCKNGEIKESPGFWLNNSFKIIVRMPSFRTKNTKISDDDLYTIENMSNGYLNSDNGDTANDFLFEDIQVHIGKVEELKEYGYPDTMHLSLNTLNTKEELAKAHIISYKHYSNLGVFSKKLIRDSSDARELLTAGALNPSDLNYRNRFIEINLSNAMIWDNLQNKLVPIYTLHPEGYYIQVRYKIAYASGSNVTQWSPWYGGSCDGGKHWWGNNGVNYYVPIRNYTDVHTDFRNWIKESYPGAKVSEGKGSLMPYGDVDNNSQNNPKDGLNNRYYYIGTGNQPTTKLFDSTTDTQIVPDNQNITIHESLNNSTMINLLGKQILLSDNNDNVYEKDLMYLKNHCSNFSIPTNVSNLHQHMWEMLYVDYIIRNMCKLYYKPDYNNTNDSFDANLKYHLSVPYKNGLPILLNWKTWGWDNTENHLFETSESIKNYKGTTNEKSIDENKSSLDTQINGERSVGPNTLNVSINGINNISNRYRWNRNKYYRKMITKDDFDELNEHLQELVIFIRDLVLSGATDENKLDPVYGTKDVIPCAPEELNFNKSRKMLIGHTSDNTAGLGSNNNINHVMMNSNYIRHLWNNILRVCQSDKLNANDTKRTI